MWAHMHDERMKGKAGSPQSRFAKESISSTLLPMHESSLATGIATGLCIFSDRERSLVYQQCHARDVKISKLIGHYVTTAQVQS